MIRLSRVFEIPFAAEEIASEELYTFTESHLGSLRSRPAGELPPEMIVNTQSAFDAFDAALSSRAQQIGALGGGTVTKNDVLALFRTRIRQRRGRVMDKFAEGSAQYKEIFPQGLSYYTKATLETVGQRMDYAVEKFTKFQGELGAPLVTEFTELRASFQGARSGQEQSKGEVAEARALVRQTRAALELQLTDNLLALARKYKGQPERAAEFFDQSLLEDPTRSEPTPPTP